MVSGENFTVRAPKCRADYKQRLRQAEDGPNVITDRSLYYAWVQNVIHSFHVKWVKCAKDFRKIEGQQIRQVVSLTERCIIEG